MFGGWRLRLIADLLRQSYLWVTRRVRIAAREVEQRGADLYID